MATTMNVESLIALYDSAAAEFQRLCKDIPNVPEDRVLPTFMQMTEVLHNALTSLCFPRYISKSLATNSLLAIDERLEFLNKLLIDLYLRLDIYARLKKVKVPPEDTEMIRYLDKVLNLFEVEGQLSAKDSLTLEQLKLEYSKLERHGRTAISSNEACLTFSLSELSGCPHWYLRSLQQVGGLFQVPINPHHDSQIVNNCHVEKTRKAVRTAFHRSAASNIDLSNRMMALNRESAKINGYSSFAEFVIESSMAETPKAVERLLQNLSSKLKPKVKGEIDKLIENYNRTHSEVDSLLDPFASYNVHYMMAQQAPINNEVVSAYFSGEACIDRIIQLLAELFNLSIEKTRPCTLPDCKCSNHDQWWHSSLIGYNVYDQRTDRHFGQFILDIYSRPDKPYAPGGVYALRDGRVDHQLASAVVLFSWPDDFQFGYTALSCFLHEMGHTLHFLLGHGRTPATASIKIEDDVREMPAKFMERLCSDPRVLSRIGRHYQTNNPIPAELINTILHNAKIAPTIFYEYQVAVSLADQAISTTKLEDAHTLFTEIITKNSVLTYDDPQFLSNFSHFYDGYVSTYYGYLWSEILADDIFDYIGDCLETSNMLRFREMILERGATCSAKTMIKDYLGRDMSSEAFFKKLGIQ